MTPHERQVERARRWMHDKLGYIRATDEEIERLADEFEAIADDAVFDQWGTGMIRMSAAETLAAAQLLWGLRARDLLAQSRARRAVAWCYALVRRFTA